MTVHLLKGVATAAAYLTSPHLYTPHLSSAIATSSVNMNPSYALWETGCQMHQAMGLHPSDCPESTQSFPFDQLDQKVSRAVQDAGVVRKQSENAALYGNKYAASADMHSLEQAAQIPYFRSPAPQGFSDPEIKKFLKKYAPKVFEEWENLRTMEFSPSFSEDPRADRSLEIIQKEIENAFAKHYQEFPFSKKTRKWLKAVEASEASLMVRSSGAEDEKAKDDTETKESAAVTNAGGNKSKAYVPHDKESICKAAGEVVQSYFDKKSLAIRFNGGQDVFNEELKLAVMLQELIGEKIGGETDPSKIPVSFVLFTNEPLYRGSEKFRVMTLSATYGHGESVVSNQGIAADSWIIL